MTSFLLALFLFAGPHVVLVTGDDEYRSEQAMPQLARILSQHHGFKTTVLFALDPDGTVNPERKDNIPGLEALKAADLMILFTRFRDLPDEQMKHIVDYVEAGKPIIGIRTATHAFDIPPGKTYARWGWKSQSPDGGFGREVLGETWVNHHGKHKVQSTRGRIAPGQEKHPILRGIRDGEVWGPTDVYTVANPLPGDSTPVLLGEVLQGMGEHDPPVAGPQNQPKLPVAWTKTYKGGRVFTTTMGSSQDLQNEAFRRLLVNATYWALGLEKKIPAKAKVDLVGPYHPTPFGFGTHLKGKRPEDY
ncbi:MAG TPA: ThuA domain-containing protein [Bryobacteraceae bacterium]|nr:ThuA domain-containing protein [Bryobacteraceae bacterium]